MKQSSPGASAVVLSVALLFSSACVTMPRKTVSRNGLGENNNVSLKLTNLNTATAVELEKLPGIGKAMAGRIVAHREQFGPFRRIEQLMMVRGISEQKFLAIRDQITVE